MRDQGDFVNINKHTFLQDDAIVFSGSGGEGGEGVGDMPNATKVTSLQYLSNISGEGLI